MEHKEYRLAAIMYTDICGFSRMMEQDEDTTLELLTFHNKLIHNLVDEHHGVVIKTIGDAFLASFHNTFDAVKCAVQVQHELASYNSTRQGMRLILRIGIHLGDIYFFENDALGEGINIASRLQACTKPGRICVSKEVYNMISNKLDLEIQPLGKVQLKNITRDIHAYEIITESSMQYDQSDRPPNMEGDAWKSETERSYRTGSHRKQNTDETFDFNEIKELVIDHIRDAGRRIKEEKLKNEMPPQTRNRINNVLSTLTEKGYLTKLEKENGQVSYGLSDSPEFGHRPPKPPQWRERRDRWADEDESEKKQGRKARKNEETEGKDYEPAPFLLFRNYKKRLEKKAESERNGFRAHLISFLAVNGFLFLLNMTVGGSFPWFLFPLGGWGIGLLSHMNGVRMLLKQKEEITNMPELTPPQLRILKKIHKAEEGFSAHLVSNAAVSAFLFMINMITSPGFPWFLIPTGAMAIGVISHWGSHSGKVRRLKKELKKQIDEMPLYAAGMSGTEGKVSSPRIVQQATQLKDAIISQIKSIGEDKNPLGEDILPLLDNYIKQITELSQKNGELEKVINGFPVHGLEKDNRDLQKKYQEAESDYMKTEYRRSIGEVEKQIDSFKELKNQKELIDLRLTSAVNSLKQMQIDLARMQSLSVSNTPSSVDLLKEKSKELSHYLTDLQSGYRELEE